MKNSKSEILKIQNLTKTFKISHGLFWRKNTFNAVNDVNLELKEGETLGIVGESGSGKSTIARCILGVEKITEGNIFYKGKDIFSLDKKEFNSLRKDIQMIFQDPYSSFDPKKKFNYSLKEPLLSNNICNKKESDVQVENILNKVGLNQDLKYRYPQQLSGGQCQRMNIARALLLKPKLLICDEPVSALDISIQAQILNLLKEIQKEYNLSYLFISHDLSVIRYMSDYIAVMYKGEIVEKARCNDIVQNPKHPYTKALINSIPPKSPYEKKCEDKIDKILDDNLKDGCKYYNRCNYRKLECTKSKPPIIDLKNNHFVSCFLY